MQQEQERRKLEELEAQKVDEEIHRNIFSNAACHIEIRMEAPQRYGGAQAEQNQIDFYNH